MSAKKSKGVVRHVWIVEMKAGHVWWPTVGCYLNEKDCIRFMGCNWQANNPDDKFRVRKYQAARAARGKRG